jgi:hypothetical protein
VAAAPPDENGAWVVIAHQYRRGDVSAKPNDWVGVPFSGHWIEGFSIGAPDSRVPPPIRYRALQTDGVLTPWAAAGAFCGARGKDLALTGFCIEFIGDAAPCGARYEARFVGGHVTGMVPFGQMCVSPDGARLEAFRLAL